VATVVGSGIAATGLSPTDTGLQLLQNSLTTGVMLLALIIATSKCPPWKGQESRARW
jgi:hypothetical protein